MDWTIIISGAGVFVGFITYLLGWIAGRKKTRVEIEKTEEEIREKRINNLSAAIKVYEKIHDDLQIQLNIVSKKCTELVKEIDLLRRENKDLKTELHTLTRKLTNTKT